MAWWIYKCNSKAGPHQVASGDWSEFFGRTERSSRWGRTDYSPTLEELMEGDIIIAYQTDRNELVGVLKVDLIEQRDGYEAILLEKLSKQYAVKLRPLKKADEEISAIPALQPGPIQTIYSVPEPDALKLLNAAGIRWIGPNQRTLPQQSTR